MMSTAAAAAAATAATAASAAAAGVIEEIASGLPGQLGRRLLF